ncbi:hypothetical protein TNCV_1501331 [Trichonephila clavipes]|uniref:Uncharacterized protein n=1 Tax=Trichonephila clavipes TaxID=2585209 RepID=A0A8X6RQ84_TRICX|nr:hypothetical protein TNCV_1501331 [Trichonephila clavipes]
MSKFNWIQIIERATVAERSWMGMACFSSVMGSSPHASEELSITKGQMDGAWQFEEWGDSSGAVFVIRAAVQSV